MRKLFFILVILMTLCFGCSSKSENLKQTESSVALAKEETKAKETKTKSNYFEQDVLVEKELGNIEFQIPESWTKDSKMNGDFSYYYGPDFMFGTQCSENSSTEEAFILHEKDYVRGIKDGYDKIDSFSNRIININGIKAIECIGDVTVSELDKSIIYVAFVQGGSIYSFTIYVNADSSIDYSDDFFKLIDSIEYINPTDSGLIDVSFSSPYWSYQGNGDDVVTGFECDGLSFAHIIHSGSGHFAVKAHHDDTYDLLVNTVNPYDGKTLLSVSENTFEVTAKGAWSIEVYKMGTSSTDAFSGSGDYVTPIFQGTSNVYEIKSEGGGHFAVKGWTDRGYELLVNTVDENYSGKVMFKNNEEAAFFEITGERNWSIQPVK